MSKHLVQFREEIYDQKFDRIIYCNPHSLNGGSDSYIDSLREHFAGLELCSELPNVDRLDLGSDESHKLIIIDDMIIQFNHSKSALRLLTIHSHHMNSTLRKMILHYFFTVFKPFVTPDNLWRQCT